MKQVGFSLVAVVMVTEVSWADPTGSANVPQILAGFTFTATASGSFQRTFLTTDAIGFAATYYDPNPACAGVAPLLTQLFVFNLEGLFIGQFNAFASPATSPLSSNYRVLNIALAAGVLSPGDYKFTFLVRDCANTKSVVQPELLTIRIVTP